VANGEGRKLWRALGFFGFFPPGDPQRRARLALVRMALQECPRCTSALFALTTVEGVLGAVQPVMNGLVIGALPAAIRHGLDGSAGDQLRLALTAMAVVFVGNLTLPGVTAALGSYVADRVDIVLRSRLMGLMAEPVGIAHLEDSGVHDDVSRAGAIGIFTPGATVWGLSDLWELRLTSVGCFVIVATFRWWLAVALLLLWLAVEAAARRQYMDTAKLVYRRTQDLRRSDYVKDVSFSDAVKELRVFGLQDWLLARFTAHWLDSIREVWRERRRLNLAVVWRFPIILLSLAGAMYVVADAAYRGEIGVGRVATFAGAILGMRSIVNYGLHRTRTEYGAITYQPLLDLTERVGALSAGPSSVPRKSAKTTGSPAIRFEDVWFRYPGTDRDIFRGLNLEVPAGRSLALVGLNGAGKTTLMKLLIRGYEPTAGRIMVDDVPLAELDPARWREQLAAIFQDFVHYPVSARENVTFGSIAHSRDDEGLLEVASSADIANFIAGLASQWDTPLSRLFEGGAELSGGEWQRVGLARALFAVRHGARLLILDEPTAALDVRAEAELFDRYLDLTKGLTSILISHRFSTVRRVDRICVLEHGQLIESGSHDELIATGGHYAHLFSLQAARFAEEAGTAGTAVDA
jgi:ATP-binding cassette, subfamily B, bacterial